jgi:hypothetical protein
LAPKVCHAAEDIIAAGEVIVRMNEDRNVSHKPVVPIRLAGISTAWEMDSKGNLYKSKSDSREVCARRFVGVFSLDESKMKWGRVF